MKKHGYVIGSTKNLAKHERATLNFFKGQGKVLQIITPSRHKNTKSPDFLMDGAAWEMKAPSSARRQTLEHAFSTAAKQSSNVVFDLRRIKSADASMNSIRTLTNIFQNSKHVHRLLIITKQNQLLEFAK